jgi:hypothetical protein
MRLHHVALVSKTKKVSPEQLSAVSAALQKQVLRDFGPLWGIQASVDAFPSLHIPLGYWPITVMDDIHSPGAGGFHSDRNHQPFALVQWDQNWTVSVSHECLEMLADPFGNTLHTGPSVDPRQSQVQYLQEICDPCEDLEFAYTIDGVMVSDFYTPHYFDLERVSGVRYDYQGAITEPRDVLKNGYLSWHNPEDDHWYQKNLILDPSGRSVDLGALNAKDGNLRNQIDRIVRERLDKMQPERASAKKGKAYGPHFPLGTIREKMAATAEKCKAAQLSRAKALRDQIESMIGPSQSGEQ